MTRAAQRQRLARALAQLAMLAAVLTAAACADNPAFKSSGEPVATTTDTTTATTTGEPVAPCPDDQPFTEYWPDADADTYGTNNEGKLEPTLACEPPAGMVDNHDDCNDKAPEVRPFVIERCNGFDDNCNRLVDEGSSLCGACTVELTSSFIYWICPQKQPITWDEASSRCKALSFKNPVRLASVHNQAEQEFLIGHLNKFDKINGEKHVWLGLRKRPGPDQTCDPPTPDSDWIWQDNTAVDYQAWIHGEPNNQSCLPPDDLENCGELKQSTVPSAVGWNDLDCDKPGYGYVCKAKGDMVLLPN